MASYEKGILGPFNGSVGAVVGTSWRGKNVMRSRPRKITTAPTESQLLQREKFALVTRFLTPIRDLLILYFGQSSGARSRYNMAISYHIQDAVQQTGHFFAILYNKVLITKGELQGMQGGMATPETGNQIQLTWADNSGQAMAMPGDSLLVVIYAPAAKAFQVFDNVAKREDMAATLAVPDYLANQAVHCWATFKNDSRKLVASSSYMGEITLL